MREALVNKLGNAIRASLSLTSSFEYGHQGIGLRRFLLRASGPSLQCGRRPVRPRAENTLRMAREMISQSDALYDNLLRGQFLKSQAAVVIRDAQTYAEGSVEFAQMCSRTRASGWNSIANRLPLDRKWRVSRRSFRFIRLIAIRRWTEDEILLVEVGGRTTGDRYRAGRIV